LSVAIVELFNKRIDFVNEHEKKLMIVEIIEKIRNSGGRFLKWSKEKQAYYEIHAEAAETKVTRALKYRKIRDDLKNSNGLYELKKTMSGSTKDHGPLLRDDTKCDATLPHPTAFNDHDAVRKHSVQPVDAEKTLPHLPSELQSMHYKEMIEQRQQSGLMTQFHGNISDELKKAYKEIDLLQAKLKIYEDRKIKLQKKIHKMHQQQQYNRQMTATMHPFYNHSGMIYPGKTAQMHPYPFATMELNPRCDDGFGISSSEESSLSDDDCDDVFQMDATQNHSVSFSEVGGNYFLTT
jgi:hypothetical protein